MDNKRQTPAGTSGGQKQSGILEGTSGTDHTTEANPAQASKGDLGHTHRVAGLQSSQGDSRPSPFLTLEEYARVKHLPQEFLEQLGLKTICSNRSHVLAVPYLDEEGHEVATSHCLSFNGGGPRFRWKKGSKACPYGLWKLTEAREAGYIFLVEGEGNAQTGVTKIG
jgi:hypothetical protein